MLGLECAALPELGTQLEDATRILPRKAVDVDRHQHSRRQPPGVQHTKDGQAAHHDVLVVPRAAPGLVEQRGEVG